MKANHYFVLTVILLMISCQKEEVQEDLEVEGAIVYEEFFKGELDGKKFEIEDPDKMGAGQSVGFESGIPALGIYGYEEGWGEIGIYFCFYEGVGSYTTGNKKDVGYSYFWGADDHYWEDLPQMNNPSEIEITYVDDDVVEGTFNVVAYNDDDTSKVIEFSGTFGLLLEEEETEN